MTAREFTEEEKKILNEALHTEKRETSKPLSEDERRIAKLAKLSPLEYEKRREEAAAELGIRVSALDQAVRKQQAASHDQPSALPHWKIEPWPDAVPGAELLADIRKEFEKYIVLPAGAADALSLWVLHAWTIDAGDISPFLVLASPTKRCGKTSVLIVLCYLTPRSELASNISSSALFRYVEEVRPTLLIDEADSFLKADKAMRGILNSGHTRAAAYVIRNVEVNGDHKPKRFSTWTAKAIAAIGELADTLQDRAVILQLQRKPKTAKVARLRKRDSDDFALLRRKAARWAADSFDKLHDPDPEIPDALDDRAADNWRPLLAIADLAGDDWPRRAREAACLLSDEGHDTPSSSVKVLADTRKAFGKDDAMRTADLVKELTSDPEQPWAEWKNGKPLTPKQLADLLKPFGIISETVHIPGLAHAKGYKRVRFEDAWAAYLPGQNTLSGQFPLSETCKRASADETGTSAPFSKRAESNLHVPKNEDLSYSHAGSHVCTAKKSATARKDELTTPEETADDIFDESDDTFGTVPKVQHHATPNNCDDATPCNEADFGIPKKARAQVESRATDGRGDGAGDLEIPVCLDRRPRCEQCNGRPDGNEQQVAINGREVWLHPECRRFYRPPPRQDGIYVSDDDAAFLESGKFK